jgi:hypothetical protein
MRGRLRSEDRAGANLWARIGVVARGTFGMQGLDTEKTARLGMRDQPLTMASRSALLRRISVEPTT